MIAPSRPAVSTAVLFLVALLAATGSYTVFFVLIAHMVIPL